MLIAAKPRHTTGVTIYGFGGKQLALYFMKGLCAEVGLEKYSRALLNVRGDALECFFTNEKMFEVDGISGRTWALTHKRGGREVAITTSASLNRGHYPTIQISPGCIVLPGAISIEEGASP